MVLINDIFLDTWDGTAVNPTANPDRILPMKMWWTYLAKAIVIQPEQRGITANWSDPLLPINSIIGPETKAPIGVAKLCTDAVIIQIYNSLLVQVTIFI